MDNDLSAPLCADARGATESGTELAEAEGGRGGVRLGDPATWTRLLQSTLNGTSKTALLVALRRLLLRPTLLLVRMP